MMPSNDITSNQMRSALSALWHEIVDGPPGGFAFVLNPSDPGLLRSLARLSAADASYVPPGRDSSVAAHVDHMRYGIELLNRWAQGEDPFATADYSASWRKTTVTEEEWAALRAGLEAQAKNWAAIMRAPRPLSDEELTGMIASVVHLAYHLGAIRQIAPTLAGPRAKD